MKIVILRSRKNGHENKRKGDYLQEFDTLYADRVIGNLRGGSGFCAACGGDCISCRKTYGRCYERDITAVIDFPVVLPYVLENPSDHIPKNIPNHDCLLVIAVHEQILLEILKRCKRWGTKGVVVPLEATDWISGATKSRAHKLCEAGDIEISFPKPFCSFNPPRGGVLSAFREHFHIGFPDVKLSLESGVITKAHVNVSAACGATYYIARWLVGRRLDEDLEIEVISKRLHSFPCTASMKWDDEIGDTPLHIAGQAHYRILSSYRKTAGPESHIIASPLGRMIQKPVPVQDNVQAIENAMAFILNEFQDRQPVTLRRLRKSKIAPAAISSALLILKKRGKIRIEGSKVLIQDRGQPENQIPLKKPAVQRNQLF